MWLCVFVRSVAHASTVFLREQTKRHAERACGYASKILRDFWSEARGQYTLPSADGTADAAGVFHLVQRAGFSGFRPTRPGSFFGELGVSIAGTALSAISAQARNERALVATVAVAVAAPVLVATPK